MMSIAIAAVWRRRWKMQTWDKLLDGDLEAMIEDYFNSGEAEKDMEAINTYQQGEPIWWYDQWCLSGYCGPTIAIFVKMGKVKNAGIAVLKRNGEWVPKWVKIENISVRIEK